ncbi:putative NRPS-like enzyme [Hyaloscypha variabilis F]|uniref:Putative NRPS-like enzyme n=1 Tax=Hyaloscypha variabilis (strain UAMH 11265 / GT02V1 / F) TaxID=1149755 RepID=A0A2J6R5V0_HYAVF|nr:putative NRPS-like enzyme [Hyaloscypha variabilis F]
MGDAGAQPVLKPQTIYTFDQVIRERASDDDQSPLIAYPKSKLGVADYEVFTGKQLDRLVDGAAKALLEAGLRSLDGNENEIVGIYGISDLDYIVTILGLGRLGYTTFILSPRLPVNACVNLLQDAGAKTLLYASQFLDLATKTSEVLSLSLIPILTREQYDLPDDTTPPFERQGVDGEKENLKKLIMMHSSGSTGLPRPIHYTHKRLLATMLTAQSLIAFQSVPLFHAHGFISFIQAIYKRKCIYMFNGHAPQTHDTVTAAIRAANPEIVWTVPYVLKLLCEKRDGIEVLKKCKVVSCSGSRCPDELGDLMVREGIHFGTAFGATEVALILTSLNRPKEDKAWNYLRPPPHIAPFIKMKPIDGPICECVVLDGHKGKMTSNSNDPPNSFHTKDLFIAHPSIHNAWKFVGRLDDRVTLTNGEKVLPLPIEGRIQQDPLVREVVVCGVDRPVPGLLLFRAEAARGLSDEEFLEKVWPAIEDANSRAEGFSQISREMVVVLGEEVDCPTTDKSSIKRAQVYREFKHVIDDVYERLESSQEGTLVLDKEKMEEWIVEEFEKLGVLLRDTEEDFFSAGVDSQKAIQMRGLIIRNLSLGGNASKCPSMVVYDSGNTAKLARALLDIRSGKTSTSWAADEISEMDRLIEEYSHSVKREKIEGKVPESNVVLLTGATGSLGSHILTKLIKLPNVSKIYCLLRTTSSAQTAIERLNEALEERHSTHITSAAEVHPLLSDLTKPDLDLPAQIFQKLTAETTHIIHCAWEVNFALPVRSFEPQLAALQNLVNLSLSSPFSRPSHLLFCSSVGTAVATPAPYADAEVTISEDPIKELTYASPTGYARSKLVAERIIEKAVTVGGARATILRIGQIIPSPKSGSMLWNPNEMIPLMVRSALRTGVLPDSPGSADRCSWIDVDTLSQAILDIGQLDRAISRGMETAEPQLVFNLVHPRPFSWKENFLPALKEAGLSFEVVDREAWLQKLRASEKDIEKNPSRKLLSFWEAQNMHREGMKIKFETTPAEAQSLAHRNTGKVVDGDNVARLLHAWRAVW